MPRCSAAWSPTARSRPASPRSRRIGNGNNLDLVPALVYALGDPDRAWPRGLPMPCGGSPAPWRTRPRPDAADRAGPPRGDSILEAMVPGDPAGGGIRHLSGLICVQGGIVNAEPNRCRRPGAVPLLACPAVPSRHRPQHCWTSQQWHAAAARLAAGGRSGRLLLGQRPARGPREGRARRSRS